MASINRTQILGNLGRDPEMRYSPDGAAICNVSVATTYAWKDKKSGERREETEWHRIVLFNRLAEIVGQYCKKGSQVLIDGRLRTRKWQDKETGADRYATEIVATQLTLLGGGNAGGESKSTSPGQPAGPAPASGTTYSDDDRDPDIPF